MNICRSKLRLFYEISYLRYIGIPLLINKVYMKVRNVYNKRSDNFLDKI